MGDPSKFSNLTIYYVFHISIFLMLIAEVVIFFYTYQKKNHLQKVNRADRGTKWLLVFNFCICIYISFFMVSHMVSAGIRNLRFPTLFSYVGVMLILAGIIVRLWAVFTLKRAFTLSVQTAESQHLITTGIYRLVRNPAYTASICSLLGIALGMRSIPALVIVLLISMVCYSARIQIEEKVLLEHFGTEFLDYEEHTYRLIPYIW